MIGLLVALYPAPWRRRYGEEFRAVLESRPLGPFDVADVLLGAVDARLALRLADRVAEHGGHLAMLRIGGFGAIIGAALWFIGLAGGSAADDGSDTVWLVVSMLGSVGLLLALTGLSGFQAHREPRLAWAAFGIPAIGTVVSLVGMAGMAFAPDEQIVGTWSGWGVWALGLLTTLIGSILFGIATIRAAVFSRRAAIALAGSAVAVIAVGTGSTGVADQAVQRILAAAGLAAFASSWMALGVSAVRRGPIRAVAPA
ncbi:MAG TPA: hypothetical protein VL749_13225 [Patescibacteria group bacterium]|nr:hypothetical protein [Patescibacteria group bacterium]